MAVDLTFPVREAVVAFLRAGMITIEETRIFGRMQPPNTPYPFVRFGSPGSTPSEYACVNGSVITADIHVFAEDEEMTAAIAKEIIAVLDDKEIPLDPDGTSRARWTGGQSLRDPDEPDIWHESRTFDFEASL